MRFIVRLLVAVLVGATVVAAEPTPSAGAKNSNGKTGNSNGISVGEPKPFDNRTLTIMLESLSATLQGIQTQSIDQKTLAAAMATFQGSRSSDVTSALSVGTLPIPSRKIETIESSGNATSSGTLLPDASKTTTTSDRSGLTLTPPALDAAPAFSGFTPTFGSSVGDLLNDQVNLSYQIFNLRMILERSLSDRLTGSDPRAQTVLGFNVTLDPPATAVDSVAVVEVTLHAEEKSLSLVALMPQEKTYNSATFSTKSNAFGGTAVVNMIPVGASTRRRSQTFYLYRDNDTTAWERTSEVDDHDIVFGWTFRPVLGRRSVPPGFRQMFAVVALPLADQCTGDELKNKKCPSQKLTARVQTYWKKYDNSTLTSFDKDQVNRARKFGYAVTFGLTKPEIFKDRYRTDRTYKDVIVNTTAAYEHNLGPQVDSVEWTLVGPKNAMISISGKNFFTGTDVVMGDKIYHASDGLLLKSNNSAQLITSLDAIASGPAVMSGRYGSAISIATKEPSAPGVFVNEARIGPSRAGVRTLTLFLQSRQKDENGKTLLLKTGQLPQTSSGDQITPLVTVNGNTIPPPYFIFDGTSVDDAVGRVVLRTSISDSMLTGSFSTIRVTWPFLSGVWTSTLRKTEPNANYGITRVGDKSFLLEAKDEFAGFVKGTNDLAPLKPDECWQLLLGDKPFKLNTSRCTGDTTQSTGVTGHAIIVTPTSAIPDRVALLDPRGATFVLDVPKLPTGDASPKQIVVTQFDSVLVDLTVDDPSKIVAVEANQQPLRFAPKSAKKEETKIRVQLTRDLTSKPGSLDITTLDDSGKTTTTRITISPCQTCK